VKKVYQYIHTEALDLDAGRLEIRNLYDFRSLDFASGFWNIMADGEEIASGALPPLSAAPGEAQEVTIPFPPITPQPGVEYWLDLSFTLREASVWAEAGHEIAWGQFRLPFAAPKPEPDLAALPQLELAESETEVVVSGENFRLRLDRATGILTSWIHDDVELIRSGPRPHFWRAPTDNDRGNDLPGRSAVWKEASRNWVVISTRVEQPAPGVVEIHVHGTLPDVDSSHDVVYSIFGNGEIEIESSFQPGKKSLPEMPRFGMQMTVPGSFDTVTWYGRGPHESYWDRKTGAAVGVYSGSVTDQYFDYSEPQENGNKTDVRWISLTGRDGLGVEAIGMPLLSTATQVYTTEDMETAKHRYEMPRRDFVTWNLDFRQTGVGGEDSWGARPLPQHILEPQPLSYAFRLRPAGKER
jgi:beta-galactosidase